MTQLEQLSQRFVGVQGAIVDVMAMVRQARTGQRPMEAPDLALLEQALLAALGELVLIPAELTEVAADTARRNAEALQRLESCQRLLEVYEAKAEQEGLIPAIINDRKFRVSDVRSLADNVVAMPNRMAGLIQPALDGAS